MMLKFLPGIILLQIVTAILVITAFSSGPHLALTSVFALIVSVLVALWFGSIANQVRKDALIRAKEAFAREREHLLVTAEANKHTVIEKYHKRIVKETSRAHAKANFKLGAAFAGMLFVGTLMLSVQFITVGLLTLAMAGGALVGYLVRARQDALALKRQAAQTVLAKPYAEKIVEAEVVKPTTARLEQKSSPG